MVPVFANGHAHGFDQEGAQQRQTEDDTTRILISRHAVRHGHDDARDDGKGEAPALGGRQLRLNIFIFIFAPWVRRGVVDVRIEPAANVALLDLAYGYDVERCGKLDNREQQ